MNNTEQRIACLYKQLDDLKASIEKKKDTGLWYPKKDEQYAYVNDWGDIYITTNTEQRIADLQKQLDELKASLEKKEGGLWYPKEDEEYFYVSEGMKVDKTFYGSKFKPDIGRKNFENVFQTNEQAERHTKRLKFYNKIWRLAEHLNGGWVPKFGGDTLKWEITFFCEDESLKTGLVYYTSRSMPVFKSKELAEKAISMLSDEEKEIFKNIYRP